MDREKQEKEVMEYLRQELFGRWGVLFSEVNKDLFNDIVQTIMRRYDLVPRGE